MVQPANGLNWRHGLLIHTDRQENGKGGLRAALFFWLEIKRASRRNAQVARARSTILAGLVFCAAPAVGQEGTACAIKGNVSDSGRLYYTPDDPRYGKVRINRKDERWFCSEEEAKAAGWEKAERSTSCVASPDDDLPDPRAPSSDCAIKGNQSGVYHLPGGRCYAETTIRADNRRERWLCSEEEARAAGFRRSRL